MNERDARRLHFLIQDLMRIERKVLRWRGGRGRKRLYDFVYDTDEAKILDYRIVQLLRTAYELLDLFGYSVYEYREGRAGAYDRYIDSDEWSRRQGEAKERAGYRCERCGRGALDGEPVGLVAHHLTYERLGHEAEEDLEVLCDDCHAEAHGRRKPR